MLKITIIKNNNIIKEVEFIGHACFEDAGKDIVCAGVSSILTTTVNAILEFDSNAIYYSKEENFILKNIKKDEITNKLLNNMYNLLCSLERDYKKNIKIFMKGR